MKTSAVRPGKTDSRPYMAIPPASSAALCCCSLLITCSGTCHQWLAAGPGEPPLRVCSATNERTIRLQAPYRRPSVYVADAGDYREKSDLRAFPIVCAHGGTGAQTP